MDNQPPQEWVTAAFAVTRGDAVAAMALALRLWQRHGVTGAKVYVQDGQLVVSHPGGIPGLESGWERVA